MPYGLANAPLIFQAFMNDEFPDMLNHLVVVYIDILIHSKSFPKHIDHVKKVHCCLNTVFTSRPGSGVPPNGALIPRLPYK